MRLDRALFPPLEVRRDLLCRFDITTNSTLLQLGTLTYHLTCDPLTEITNPAAPLSNDGLESGCSSPDTDQRQIGSLKKTWATFEESNRCNPTWATTLNSKAAILSHEFIKIAESADLTRHCVPGQIKASLR